MKNKILIAILALAVTLPLAEAANAAGTANWKIGRVYNRLVCNACHRLDGGHVVSPYERTKAEWTSYFDADAHAASGKAKPKVSHYTSTAYRESIRAENKAAAKFLKFTDDQMAAHVRAFFIRGAKDSDTPARCQ